MHTEEVNSQLLQTNVLQMFFNSLIFQNKNFCIFSALFYEYFSAYPTYLSAILGLVGMDLELHRKIIIIIIRYRNTQAS